MHALGYFKKVLSHEEKSEVLDHLDMYKSGLVPLVVPLTLIRHYIMKYDQTYLKEQLYFHPHPLEILLRNHV
jgi:uncharacterized protein YbgA (DUF1722 family)